MQFTLFCFLDAVPRVPRAKRFANEIPRLVQDYLMNVPTDTALAAWMAGHMMGDHWPRRGEAVGLLIRVLADSSYVAGRLAAFLALKNLLATDVSSGMRRKIKAALERAQGRDRSKLVRA